MEDVIDQSALQRLLAAIGGDPEDLAELIEDFESTTPAIVQSMREAAAAGDFNALRISTHSLKSNGRDFGATALATACETLEHACRDGSVDDAVGSVSAIAEMLEAARTALTSLPAADE